ncbi:hypothetical protein K438DRAFT_1780783 [Mycena galopus ATCC 62051]|nr:hypothetical protein K438DRAFT_1780783 [Mycena galopus ATCC 62051]
MCSGSWARPLTLSLCALAASFFSIPPMSDTLYLPPNELGVLRHSGLRYRKILSAFELVCCASRISWVVLRWSTWFRLAGLGGSGGATEGAAPPLHLSDSRWMIGLSIGSLLNRIAALRPSWSTTLDGIPGFGQNE